MGRVLGKTLCNKNLAKKEMLKLSFLSFLFKARGGSVSIARSIAWVSAAIHRF